MPWVVCRSGHLRIIFHSVECHINMADDREFETHDIYLAAFFRMRKASLVRMRRQGPRKYFIFSHDTESLRSLRESYFNGAIGNLHQFQQEIMAMKQLCFDE